MRVISSVLLAKDKPNSTEKVRLYYIQFYNELELYVTGLTIQSCIDKHAFKCKIKKYHTIDSWKDLLQKQSIITTYINNYRTKCINLANFSCYYDEYANNYYVINDTTRDAITLK